MINVPENTDADFARELEAVEADCRQRMTKIRQNSRMKDVIQLQQVTLSETLRARATEVRILHQLTEAAELRMRELLDGHLQELRSQRDMQGLEQLRSHFMHREWTHLKGTYPLLQRAAETESEKLVARLEYETDVRRKKRPSR